MIDTNIVIAAALVLLLLVFIRISWTLKEIHEAIVSLAVSRPQGKAEAAKPLASDSGEAAIDETEIAAVIAVASAAMKAAV